MRIDPETGRIEVGEGGLVIHSEMNRGEFLNSPTGASARLVVENDQYATYSFTFKIDSSLFGLSIIFESQRLDSVQLEKLTLGKTWGNWSKARELERKDEHDQLLVSFLGKPPYRFAWGEIVSECDPRSGSANINIRYRKER